MSGKIIIRDAWSERTSSSTDDSLSSAHRTGKIATIALSLPINKSVTLVEMKHYEYDTSMQLQLASVSHCMDFQYVRVNAGQGSVTVGVNDCFSSEIRYEDILDSILYTKQNYNTVSFSHSISALYTVLTLLYIWTLNNDYKYTRLTQPPCYCPSHFNSHHTAFHCARNLHLVMENMLVIMMAPHTNMLSILQHYVTLVTGLKEVFQEFALLKRHGVVKIPSVY